MDQKWFLPATVLPSNITTSLGALRQYLAHPPSIEDPKGLLRRARAQKPVRRRRDSLDSDGEEIPKIRRKKKAAEVQVFKSAAFIDDSDDDDDADAAFFAREKRLREEMQVMAEKNGHAMLDKGTRKRKRGDKKKGKGRNGEVVATAETLAAQVEDEDADMEDSDDQEEDPSPRKRGSSLSDSVDSDGVGDDDDASEAATGREGDIEKTQATQRTKTKRVIESDSEDE